MSERIISVYDSRNLSEILSTEETQVSPSTLIPFYDEDSAVLFLTAKVCINRTQSYKENIVQNNFAAQILLTVQRL